VLLGLQVKKEVQLKHFVASDLYVLGDPERIVQVGAGWRSVSNQFVRRGHNCSGFVFGIIMTYACPHQLMTWGVSTLLAQ
jgi:hypothetical protein